MIRRDIRNLPPGDPLSKGSPRDAIKVDFAKRLQQAMTKKGWNQSELARRATQYLEEGDIGRDNISHYIRAVSLPRSAQLLALCKALGVQPTDLIPTAPTAAAKAPAAEMKMLPDGNIWVRVNQALPPEPALEVMRLVTTFGVGPRALNNDDDKGFRQ
jgi:transcriptional regulator with XRE-family HTH domain